MQKRMKLKVRPGQAVRRKPEVRKKSGSSVPLAVIAILVTLVIGFMMLKPSGSTGVQSLQASQQPEIENHVAEVNNNKAPVQKALLDLKAVKKSLPTGMVHDFLKGDKIPKESNRDWNLGPTGLRGWMYTEKLDTAQARQICVVKVAKGSPADGKLQINDIILGVEEKLFSYDPRVELGRAIGKVEADDGKLSFIISRGGKISRVELQLKIMGAYSQTAPFSCKKSSMILKNGCKKLAENLKKAQDKKVHWIVRSMNALALLASGEAKYLPLVKKEVEKVCSAKLNSGYCSWNYGPANLLVAEYILATGDRSFMKGLERITQEIIDGQSEGGGWGHRFIAANGLLEGYGMMNIVGLQIAKSLILSLIHI